jgi:hypothetical protein
MLKGKVQLLEAERGHAVVRHAWERERRRPSSQG